jgi:hypothetical protein
MRGMDWGIEGGLKGSHEKEILFWDYLIRTE